MTLNTVIEIRKESSNIMVDLHNGGHVELMACPGRASVTLGIFA